MLSEIKVNNILKSNIKLFAITGDDKYFSIITILAEILEIDHNTIDIMINQAIDHYTK